MKKVISMVMAAAMVTSLVPATAFAAGYTYDVTSTAKIVNAQNYSDKGSFDGIVTVGPELWIDVKEASYSSDQLGAANGVVTKFTVQLDNATLGNTAPKVSIYDYDKSKRFDSTSTTWSGTNVAKTDIPSSEYSYSMKQVDSDEFEVTIQRDSSNIKNGSFENGDAIIIGLGSHDTTDSDRDGVIDNPVIKMDSHGRGKTAEVAVYSDDVKITNENTELTFASVEAKGITASTRKTVTVATDEKAELEDITIKPSVTDTFAFGGSDVIRLKPSAGFEFVKNDTFTVTDEDGAAIGSSPITVTANDVDEIVFNASAANNKKRITISGLELKADTAKAGATGSIKVYATDCPAVNVEVAKVTDFAVSMTVDADEDLPVIYSGVDVENTGLTDGSDHMSKEITIKESFPGAWNNSKDFTLTLPEGVYAVDHVATKDGVQGSIKANLTGNFINGTSDTEADLRTWFGDAYAEGDYDNMVFEKRTWNESNPNNNDEPSEITFRLQLVAAPNYEGEVTLKLEGDAMETQEVKIAKFVKPYTVKAEQNDLKIDYRRTEIPTTITITEAAPGLWDKGTEFQFRMEKISFDDDATYTVDEKSGMTIKGTGTDTIDGDDVLKFAVDKTSSDEAATVTLSGMSLYMERNLPAGAYDLSVYSPTMENDRDTNTADVIAVTNHEYGLLGQPLMGTLDTSSIPTLLVKEGKVGDNKGDFYSNTAKAGFVNIITSGREDSDSFTTKVVVPVGEKYIVAGEQKQDLDVPAYINAAGYTMLPVRAVAKALGIPSDNVIWNGEARTVTIMYGSKIVTMTAGQKIMYVNGAPVPTSSSVEIVEIPGANGLGRAFLPLRDLGIALGVADITWDAATRTATLNGSK